MIRIQILQFIIIIIIITIILLLSKRNSTALWEIHTARNRMKMVRQCAHLWNFIYNYISYLECFVSVVLMSCWYFRADRISCSIPWSCPESLSTEGLVWFAPWNLWPSQGWDCAPSLLSPSLMRGNCGAENDEWIAHSKRKSLTWELSSNCSTLWQQPNRSLLFAIEACGHPQILEVRFYEQTCYAHTHVKMIQLCLTPRRAFIFLGHGKSWPQKHSEVPFTWQVYFSARRNIPQRHRFFPQHST